MFGDTAAGRTLFGAALWSSAEAFAAAGERRTGKSAVALGEAAPELGG
jgi:hypothetical protein